MDEYPYLMTEILPLIVEYILEQGIRKIGAIINRKNIAARKVLEKADFIYKTKFDQFRTYIGNPVILDHLIPLQLEQLCGAVEL